MHHEHCSRLPERFRIWKKNMWITRFLSTEQSLTEVSMALITGDSARDEAPFRNCEHRESQMSNDDGQSHDDAGKPTRGPDGAEPKRYREAVLKQAFDIRRDIADGLNMVEIARKCQDPMSLGIGAMLAKMIRDGLIREPEQIIDLLNGAFVGESSTSIDLNRRTVIETLRKDGILPPGMNVRKAKPGGTMPALDEIGAVIERRTGIALERITSASRIPEVVRGRHIVMWIMRNVCGSSLTAIADRFGGGDHISIMDGIQRLDDERDSDKDERMLIDSMGDESDLLALKRNRSDLASSKRFRKNGQGGGTR